MVKVSQAWQIRLRQVPRLPFPAFHQYTAAVNDSLQPGISGGRVTHIGREGPIDTPAASSESYRPQPDPRGHQLVGSQNAVRSNERALTPVSR